MKALYASSVIMGDGNNTFKAGALRDGSSVSAGDGDNSIQVYIADSGTSVTLGDGNNDIFISQLRGNASLSAGDSDNSTQIGRMQDESSVSLGDGSNVYLVAQLSDSAFFNVNGTLIQDIKNMPVEEREVVYAAIDERRATRKENELSAVAVSFRAGEHMPTFEEGAVSNITQEGYYLIMNALSSNIEEKDFIGKR